MAASGGPWPGNWACSCGAANKPEQVACSSQDCKELRNISGVEMTGLVEIGHGAFGKVFRCLWHGKVAAVKQVPTQGGGAPSFARQGLGREVKILAAFDHKNIIRTFGTTQMAGEVCIVMEFAEGGTLKDYIEDLDDPMPLSEVLGAMLDIASGLEYAHARGIAHNDLKAENILRTFRGRCKIADYGLGRGAAGNTVVSYVPRTGEGLGILGTLGWASPENHDDSNENYGKVRDGKLYTTHLSSTCLHQSFCYWFQQ